MKLSKGGSYLVDLFFPRGLQCVLCGKELFEKEEKEREVCEECFGELYNNAIVRKYPELSVHSCFFYKQSAKDMVHAFKVKCQPHIAHTMAYFMAEKFRESDIKVDYVCGVPTAESKVRARGYDNMAALCEEFCEMTGLTYNRSLFALETADQTEVSLTMRAQNVSDVFLCRDKMHGVALLLDDIVTTGSTLRSCAKVLLSHGVEKVVGLTFAGVEDKFHQERS